MCARVPIVFPRPSFPPPPFAPRTRQSAGSLTSACHWRDTSVAATRASSSRKLNTRSHSSVGRLASMPSVPLLSWPSSTSGGPSACACAATASVFAAAGAGSRSADGGTRPTLPSTVSSAPTLATPALPSRHMALCTREAGEKGRRRRREGGREGWGGREGRRRRRAAREEGAMCVQSVVKERSRFGRRFVGNRANSAQIPEANDSAGRGQYEGVEPHPRREERRLVRRPRGANGGQLGDSPRQASGNQV